jgi:hypothetical protein
MCERGEKWLTACTWWGGMARIATWAILLGIALLIGLVAAPYFSGRHDFGVSSAANSPVGTTGHDSALEPEDSPATLHDLETLTGAIDQHELIGSRVDLHVKVRDINNDMSFWIGSKDNRVLVVHSRIEPFTAGQTARIIGSIEMRDQMAYIRADNVIPEG